MPSPFRIAVLTHSASPYQVELFNEVSRTPNISIRIIYLFQRDSTRSWGGQSLKHESVALDQNHDALQIAKQWLDQSDLLVANFYNHPAAMKLISLRSQSRQPWVFWGERPGFRGWSYLGTLVRRWKLRALHQSRAPIWGIGRFAVNRYRKEFGDVRNYADIPYFSDLTRFQKSQRRVGRDVATRTFLFSGALIPRKGVDLLARSFARLASEFPHVCLKIMGNGELRSEMERQLRSCADRVEFLGFKDWEHLPEFYQQADVLCVPSRYDGWGLVVPEGLAAGLPVIGTDRMGAALEFIENGRNGWLVSAGDEAQLHAALREAADLPVAKLEEYSARAAASVAQHTLANGAARFIAASRDAVAHWSN